MRVRGIFDEEDAVAPVVGITLLVAITVILAATVAAFVLGVGSQENEAIPSVSFEFDYEEDGGPTGDAILVTKTVGDEIDGKNIYICGVNPDPVSFESSNYGADKSIDDYSIDTTGTSIDPIGGYTSGSDMNAGQDFQINYGGTAGDASDYEVTLVYIEGEDPVNEDLVTNEGPDA